MEWARRISTSNWFNHSITGVILLNAVVIGLDTSPALAKNFGAWFTTANHLFLGVFIVEAVIKILAEYPKISRYFKDG